MRNHTGIPSYLYNASNSFRKHRSPQDYDKTLLQTVAVGISRRASPQPNDSSNCPPLIGPCLNRRTRQSSRRDGQLALKYKNMLVDFAFFFRSIVLAKWLSN